MFPFETTSVWTKKFWCLFFAGALRQLNWLMYVYHKIMQWKKKKSSLPLLLLPRLLLTHCWRSFRAIDFHFYWTAQICLAFVFVFFATFHFLPFFHLFVITSPLYVSKIVAKQRLIFSFLCSFVNRKKRNGSKKRGDWMMCHVRKQKEKVSFPTKLNTNEVK